MTVATPLTPNRSPSAGFDEPFGMLLACHERVLGTLGLLSRLADHLRAQGAEMARRRGVR